MSFEVGKQLTPSEVYYAAVGMFLSAGCKEIQKITSGIEGVPELGRIFEKDGKLHALYFPGKDNNDQMSAENPTLPLASVKAYMDVELADNFAGRPVEKHMVICESNHRKHFVYVRQELFEREDDQKAYWHFYDSKSKKRLRLGAPYDLRPIKNVLLPGWEDARGAVLFTSHYYGIQKNQWSCGYYSLLFMEKMGGLFGDSRSKRKFNGYPRAITGDIIARFKTYYDLAYPKPPVLEEDESAKILAMDDEFAAFNKSNALSPRHESKISSSKEGSFFQCHRKTKYALIGLGIGLGLAAAGLALAFAWPVVLPAVGGLIAAHIAVGAMATATVGWLGVAALGLAATAISTGVSLLVKRIKDKVKGVKPAEGVVEAPNKAPFQGSHARQEKITRRRSMGDVPSGYQVSLETNSSGTSMSRSSISTSPTSSLESFRRTRSLSDLLSVSLSGSSVGTFASTRPSRAGSVEGDNNEPKRSKPIRKQLGPE